MSTSTSSWGCSVIDRIVDIAIVAHEANRAYCRMLCDDSQPSWEDAPQWQRDSALAGVEAHIASGLTMTPEQTHESWLAAKAADGWVYGPVKDAEAKTHPCCVPYDQLPEAQRVKDHLFRAIVHALAPFIGARRD